MKKDKRRNNKAAQELRGYEPFKDFDKDGISNLLDCDPLDPTKHGLWGKVSSWAGRQIRKSPTYKAGVAARIVTRSAGQKAMARITSVARATVGSSRGTWGSTAPRRTGISGSISRQGIQRTISWAKRNIGAVPKEIEQYYSDVIPFTSLSKSGKEYLHKMTEGIRKEKGTISPRITGIAKIVGVPIKKISEFGKETRLKVIKKPEVVSTRFRWGVDIKPKTIVVPKPKFPGVSRVITPIKERIYEPRKLVEIPGVLAIQRAKEKIVKPIEYVGRIPGKVGRAWEKRISPIIKAPLTYRYYEREPPRSVKEQWHRKMSKEEVERLYKPYTKEEVITTTWKRAGKRFTGLVSEPVHTIIGGKRQKEIVKQERVAFEAYKATEKLVKPEWIRPSGEIVLPATESPESKKYVTAYKTYETEQAKLEAMPKPRFSRRFGMGAGTMIASLPGFVAFEAPRIGAETVIKPTAAPGKAVGFGKEMYEFGKVKPVEFAGSLAAMWAIGGFKGAPVKPKIHVAELPKAKAISIGVETVRRPGFLRRGGFAEFYPAITVGVKSIPKPKGTMPPVKFPRFYDIRSFIKGEGPLKRVSIGKPKVRGELYGKKPIEITSPFEARLAISAIPAEAAKIAESRAVLRYIVKAGVKPKALKPIIRETLEQHGLTKSTDTVIKLLKKEKADLHGSIMQEAATRRFGITRRTPKDIDLKVADTKRFARNAIKEINRAEGREAVILKGDKVIIKKTGEKLFDIHAKEVPKDYGSIFGGDYIGLGMKEQPYIRTAEGLKTTTLLRQTTRKFTAAQTIAGITREFPMGIGKAAEVFRGMKYTSKLKSKILKGHPKGEKSIISGGTDRLQFHHIVKTGKGETGILLTYKEHLAIETAMGRLGPAIGKDTLFYKLFRERKSLIPKEAQDIIKYGKSKQVRNEVNYILKEIKARETGIESFTIKGRIMPEHKGRVKDIADAYFDTKAMIEGLKLKGRVVSAKRAEVHLDRWLDSWGKDVAKYTKDLYKETVKKEGGTKAWLGSFDKKPISPSESYKMVSQIKYVAPVSAIPSGVLTYQIPSSITGVSVIPSAIPSAIPSRISTIPSVIPSVPISVIPSGIPSKIPSKPSKISIIPSDSKFISRIIGEYKPPKYPPYKPPSKPPKYPPVKVPPYKPPSGPPYKPPPYKPPYVPPIYVPPYKYPPYEPPYVPSFIVTPPPPPVTKPPFIPKPVKKIKKPRKDPWLAYQTAVKNPILSADELIKKML